MKLNFQLVFVLLNIYLITSVYGFYDKKSDVISLTSKNFAQTVFGNSNVWLVEFYAPWCGHCKSLKPEYEKAATNLKGLVKVAAVNCDEEKEVCGFYEIKGFPTIKLFPSEVVPAPKLGKDAVQKLPIDYQGQRTAAELVKFATGKIKSNVKKVTDKNLEKFLTAPGSKVLLFSNLEKTSNLYKALSTDFQDTLPLGEYTKPTQELIEKYKLEKLPVLLVFPSDDGVTYERYTGKLDHQSLYEFFEPFQSKKSDSKRSPQTSSQQTEEIVRYDTAIEIKDSETFEKVCLKGGLCSVALFDMQSEDDKESNLKYIEHLNQLAKEFAGKLKLVWFDGSTQSKFIDELRLAGLPNMFVVNPTKMRFTQYLGSYSYESMKEFFDSVLSGQKKSAPITSMPSFINPTTTTPPPKKSHDEL